MPTVQRGRIVSDPEHYRHFGTVRFRVELCAPENVSHDIARAVENENRALERMVQERNNEQERIEREHGIDIRRDSRYAPMCYMAIDPCYNLPIIEAVNRGEQTPDGLGDIPIMRAGGIIAIDEMSNTTPIDTVCNDNYFNEAFNQGLDEGREDGWQEGFSAGFDYVMKQVAE